MKRSPEVPQPQEDIGHGSGVTPDQWREIKDWWLKDVVPQFKDWTVAQVEDGASYLRANRRGATELISSKLQGPTRLVIIGMTQDPHVDNLPSTIIKTVPNLNFIAVEARDPNDTTGGFEEDKKGLTTVDLGKGIKMDMPHEEAKRVYPEKYRDPDAKNPAYDDVIAEAKGKGIDVLYTLKGTTWKDMNRLAADEITEYMQKDPKARGIYLPSVYSALKWPGYSSKKEEEALEFSRPLTTAHIFATNPRHDDSIRMPAFTLTQQFPGQVASLAQFVMPRGFGAEWKNLRAAVLGSGIRDRFAIVGLANSPFAIQRQIFRGAVELSEVPDEKLWKYFGTLAQGFFGPAETNWDRVLDGVIIYPSTELVPPTPTKEQLMEATMGHIKNLL